MMTHLENLLVALTEDIIEHESVNSSEGCIQVDALDLALPLETLIHTDGRLAASIPRSRLSTGFERPVAQLLVSMGRPTQ